MLTETLPMPIKSMSGKNVHFNKETEERQTISFSPLRSIYLASEPNSLVNIPQFSNSIIGFYIFNILVHHLPHKNSFIHLIY